MTYQLSILIAARNEVYGEIDLLAETVENVLANTSDACEIVCVLDGYQPSEPQRLNHPRVTVIHHSKSIGQRAACNEAARVARGEWVCKLDAHCAVGPEFDTRLLAGMEPDWTIVPGQYNLNVSNWKCKKCDWTQDHGVQPQQCGKCKSRFIKQVKVWKPRDGNEGRRRTYTHNWRFDSTLTFQYWGEGAADKDYCTRHKIPYREHMDQPVHDTMCLLGACWAIRRDRYFDLNICDEKFGSWGNQGVEVACKSWLSGGRLVVNQATWFAHFFRVGGINFPYPDGGRKERAVARSKELWLKNAWPMQVYPLSWLLERFWPVPDWCVEGNAVFEDVRRAGDRFKSAASLGSFTGNANVPFALPFDSAAQGMTTTAEALSSSPNIVPVVSNEGDVGGIAAGLILTNDMIENGDALVSSARQGGNQPSVHESVGQLDSPTVSDMSIAPLVAGTTPDPTSRSLVDDNSKENISKSLSAEMSNSKESSSHGLIIPSKLRGGILYYTCLSHDLTLELAARENLRRAANGHEVGCVSLNQRADFGDWNVVVQREKSGTTMHYQILEGLQRSRADYVFLCESDVLYHPSHFDFTPERDDTFYYNTNVWRIRYQDGHAVRTDRLQQVSGICASRKLLLDHYRRRIQLIEANGGQFDVKKYAYEPGTRGNFDSSKVANWESAYPNIDITGHGKTLTKPKFSVDEFRNPKYSRGWQETDDALPGWPQLSNGGLQRLLETLANGIHT